MAEHLWHRVGREAGRPVYTGGKAQEPGKGVWVKTLAEEDGGQTTTEAIAVDGVVVWQKVCFCGYDRHLAFEEAAKHLPEKRGGR